MLIKNISFKMNMQNSIHHIQHKSGHNEISASDNPTTPTLSTPSPPDTTLVPAPSPMIDPSSLPCTALLSTQVSPSPSSSPACKAISIVEVFSDLTSYKEDNDENESEMKKRPLGQPLFQTGT